jgi:cytochrome oxidase Cu insertion factor (SCO1/SenC/PrrC family)
LTLTTDATVTALPGHRRDGGSRRWPFVAAAALCAIGAASWWASRPAGAPPAPPASLGNVVDRAIPASLLDAPLVDQGGRARPLSSFRGEILVLAPFLTSCQEECPITTGALLLVARDLRRAGLAGKVQIAEASVDPGRDVPSRLAAYARMTGASWPLLTSSPSTMAALWTWFGVYVQRVPEGSPPGIDWQTGRPYTYDVDHSDGFILIGPRQHERFMTVASADVGGTLDPTLSGLLDAQGEDNLHHPPPGSWTVAQALRAIGWLAGKAIPPAG